MTNSVLKSAGMTSPEVGLLKEIAGLKQTRAAVLDEKKKQQIEKQVELSLIRERQKKLGKKK